MTPLSLVLASHNLGKIAELEALCAPLGVTVHSAQALSLPEPDEVGTTFGENAILKAEAACSSSGLWALADDSGLCVEALSGEPGIYSARWAGPDKDFGAAMAKIHKRLRALPSPAPLPHRAHFVCALALARPGERTHLFEGRADGTLVWPPRGTSGFGYDPIFQPLGEEKTFGEMAPNLKEALSHRTKAFALFLEFMKTLL